MRCKLDIDNILVPFQMWIMRCLARLQSQVHQFLLTLLEKLHCPAWRTHCKVLMQEIVFKFLMHCSTLRMYKWSSASRRGVAIVLHDSGLKGEAIQLASSFKFLNYKTKLKSTTDIFSNLRRFNFLENITMRVSNFDLNI